MKVRRKSQRGKNLFHITHTNIHFIKFLLKHNKETLRIRHNHFLNNRKLTKLHIKQSTENYEHFPFNIK